MVVNGGFSLLYRNVINLLITVRDRMRVRVIQLRREVAHLLRQIHLTAPDPHDVRDIPEHRLVCGCVVAAPAVLNEVGNVAGEADDLPLEVLIIQVAAHRSVEILAGLRFQVRIAPIRHPDRSQTVLPPWAVETMFPRARERTDCR